MIDNDEYPQTAAIEDRCVHILADLWGSPEPHTTIGVGQRAIVLKDLSQVSTVDPAHMLGNA